jgi:hypothetical protein
MNSTQELAQELRDLQAIVERFGIDDDDALNRAADKLEAAEAKLREVGELTDKFRNGKISPLDQ